MIVGVFVLPIYLVSKILPIHLLIPRWVIFCDWWQLLTLFVLVCSFHSVIIITYDRLTLVRDPLSYVTDQSYKRAFKHLTYCWIFSISVVILYFFLLWFNPIEGTYRNNACGILHARFFEHPILRYATVLEPFALSTTLIGLNIGIVVNLYRRSKELAIYNVTDGSISSPITSSTNHQEMETNISENNDAPDSLTARVETTTKCEENITNRNICKNDWIMHLKKCRKAIHKLFILVSVYKICFFPWYIMTIFEAFSFEVNFTVIEMANIFMWLNSMVNPFLYASTNIRIRRGMTSLLRG